MAIAQSYASTINKCSHSSFIYALPIYFHFSKLTNPPTGKKTLLQSANRAHDEFVLRVSEFLLNTFK